MKKVFTKRCRHEFGSSVFEDSTNGERLSSSFGKHRERLARQNIQQDRHLNTSTIEKSFKVKGIYQIKREDEIKQEEDEGDDATMMKCCITYGDPDIGIKKEDYDNDSKQAVMSDHVNYSDEDDNNCFPPGRKSKSSDSDVSELEVARPTCAKESPDAGQHEASRESKRGDIPQHAKNANKASHPHATIDTASKRETPDAMDNSPLAAVRQSTQSFIKRFPPKKSQVLLTKTTETGKLPSCPVAPVIIDQSQGVHESSDDRVRSLQEPAATEPNDCTLSVNMITHADASDREQERCQDELSNNVAPVENSLVTTANIATISVTKIIALPNHIATGILAEDRTMISLIRNVCQCHVQFVSSVPGIPAGHSALSLSGTETAVARAMELIQLVAASSSTQKSFSDREKVGKEVGSKN